MDDDTVYCVCDPRASGVLGSFLFPITTKVRPMKPGDLSKIAYRRSLVQPVGSEKRKPSVPVSVPIRG